jgi:hypothetical protein
MTHREDIPGHGETETETHHEPPTSAAPHGVADHVPEHDTVVIEHDPHATLGPGPVDVPRWSAAAVGVALGLIVALCFVAAAGAVGV